jgi:hypothetical protein
MKKEDANSHYDMPKSRAILDVRMLDSIFEVDDKPQLPLISTIH